jgi:hypothetical protein
MTERSFSEIAGNRFIAKRTKSGLVIRELERGQTKNQWFVRVDAKEDLGEAKRMSVGSNPTFTEIDNHAERETVYFHARRAYNTGLIG